MIPAREAFARLRAGNRRFVQSLADDVDPPAMDRGDARGRRAGGSGEPRQGIRP
jgi:hypothetical protein